MINDTTVNEVVNTELEIDNLPSLESLFAEFDEIIENSPFKDYYNEPVEIDEDFDPIAAIDEILAKHEEEDSEYDADYYWYCDNKSFLTDKQIEAWENGYTRKEIEVMEN